MHFIKLAQDKKNVGANARKWSSVLIICEVRVTAELSTSLIHAIFNMNLDLNLKVVSKIAK